MDFDEFLKLFFLYTAVAFGGGLFIGKVMDGFRHWRTASLFLSLGGALIWGACDANGFGWGLALIGWGILLTSYSIGGFWVLTLRLRERIRAEEAARRRSPPVTAFDRNEAQTWIWANQRFSHEQVA